MRGSSSTSSASLRGEQVLLDDERVVAQPAVRREVRGVVGAADEEARRGDARVPARMDSSLASDATAGHRIARHPPTLCSTPHAPHAAQPAFWSAPAIPASRSAVGDLAGHLLHGRGVGRRAPSTSTASVPGCGRNGTTKG